MEFSILIVGENSLGFVYRRNRYAFERVTFLGVEGGKCQIESVELQLNNRIVPLCKVLTYQ